MPSSVKQQLMELTDLLPTTRTNSSLPRQDTELRNKSVVQWWRHFRVYLRGDAFTIITDLSSLKYLARVKVENGRLASGHKPYNHTSLKYCINLEHRTAMLMGCLDNPGHRTSHTSSQLLKMSQVHQRHDWF